jgi:hypothetical protein
VAALTWQDVAPILGRIAPILGTLIGGPAGAAVGGLVASALGTGADPQEVVTALQTNPDAAVKLKQIEKDRQVELQGLLVQHAANQVRAETEQMVSVNQTMQVETKAEHWWSSGWRPFIGFSFGLYICSMFMLPLFEKTPVTLSPDVMLAVGGILGVASWFRGKAQADPSHPAPVRG